MNTMKGLLVALVGMAGMAFAQTVAFKWVDTVTFKGIGTCQTAPFKLQSDKWKVAYKPKGKTPLEIGLCDATTGIQMEVTRQTRPGQHVVRGSRSGFGQKECGYLRIDGEVTLWELVVSQYLDIPGEWYLRKWKSPANRLLPFGSWSGSAGERSWSLEFKDRMGRFVCTQNKPGRVSFEVIDEAGRWIGKMVSVAPGKLETWFYRPGVYTVIVSAIETDWNLQVDTVVK